MSIAYKENGVWKTVSGIPPIDGALSSTSENPVQNKIVKQAVDGKSNTGHNHDERYYTEAEDDSFNSAQDQFIDYLNGRFRTPYRLTKKDDLNDVIGNGIYMDHDIGDTPLHMAPDYNHVYLVLYQLGRCVQLSFSFNAGKWYWRRGYNNGVWDNWDNWTEL